MIDSILTIFDEQLMYALTWTILHSMWQGLLIAVTLSICLKVFQSRSSTVKYRMAISSLFILLAAGVMTFCLYFFQNTENELATGVNNIQVLLMDSIPSLAESQQYLDANTHFVFMMWVSGVFLLLMKLIVSLGYVQYLKKGETHQKLTYSMTKLSERLGISRTIDIYESSRVSVPLVIGFLKPIILFPVGVVNALSIDEVEGIIAHELAHIKRNDYIINIIQTLIEIVYYYHPAVWWISHIIKSERENSCDDIALSIGIDRLTYAKALMKIQDLQPRSPSELAMTLTKNKNELLNRINRILKMKQTKYNMREKSIATLLVVAVVVLFSSKVISETTSTIIDDTHSLTPIVSEIKVLRDDTHLLNQGILMSKIDTLPKSKSKVQIHTETDGKSMSLTKEDGEITELKIDGKVIPKSEYDNYKEFTDDVIIMNGNGGHRMMFFGNDDDTDFKSFNFDFDSMIDTTKMREMRKQFENFDFVFPEMGNMEELMDKLSEGGQRFDMGQFFEQFGDNMNNFQFDSLSFPKGFKDGRMKLFFNDEDNDFSWSDDGRGLSSSGKVVDVIGNELNRDGLLEPYKQNTVQLTGKHLKINGEKQPTNIWSKYKRLYEEHTGMLMSKKARMDFQVEGKKSNRRIRSF